MASRMLTSRSQKLPCLGRRLREQLRRRALIARFTPCVRTLEGRNYERVVGVRLVGVAAIDGSDRPDAADDPESLPTTQTFTNIFHRNPNLPK